MTGHDWEENVPEEAFSILGHEVRLDILRAFFDTYEPLDPDSLSEVKDKRHLSYSELMAAVDMQDSGKFNYHLEKLRGVYVENVGDKYAPTAGAVAIYRAVVANRPTEQLPSDFDIEAPCPNCESKLRGQYEQEYLTIDCPECDVFWGLTYAFPKNGIVAQQDEDISQPLYDRAMYHVGLARTGQCPSCAGAISSRIPQDRLDGEQTPTAEMSCKTCSWLATVDIVSALQFEPRVASALLELGVSPATSSNMQATESLLPHVRGWVQSDEPFRAAVDVEFEGSVATLVVDDDLTVHTVEVE
ncbi:ArsR family transcriptional regulator [Haloferax mediterranei ATCC 33500]|uniref:ArsR family transcriptional regulator n=1 Tax=Haloferax mediterranei (strain ATCC 33500 / DSM 1411 / JCM 8866 / NBRC 14739 / NCIMB 2177 / R-4) TaxID=523841 RepID=I3R7K9_HALMT|nr:helix-turn-helix domain-containing protein [Haloferax mediterranei]AFK20219.1 hypothetical protein HFX_2538 [Haloferax mediterranei ATCC 33500]AHZ23593.1 hypothetical protein BM92_13510 [Haloferax mediterranei ATCC 33500]ELZ99077.1 hypothetical protein C439_14499 [Haloferax mediterranei ATCC 33500]MDX5987026.1 helix-turn-helix domain-containing protein [Haloferax mediterranei ATCC 33500]QCQ76343.1 ArsR family transcriptional regulator [Haloferax mediterranei ATCC 33500]